MTADLVLHAESRWVSPWVFHAMVALEEKQLAYDLVVDDVPWPAAEKLELEKKSLIAKVPILVHGDLWLTESLAISEYLAETFPYPKHPRLFPEDLRKRARARQLLLFLRTDLFALREDRPTTTIFGRQSALSISPAAAAEAKDLLRIATELVAPGATALFGEFSIADADLALVLMRLVRNGDPVPSHLVDYAEGVWARPSVAKFLAYAAAAHRALQRP